MSRKFGFLAAALFHVAILVPTECRATILGTVEQTFDFNANDVISDPTRTYVYATTSSALEIINTSTLTVAKTIPLADGGYGMAISPNGSSLYIAGGTSDSVYTVNLSNQTMQGSLAVGDVASSVAAGLNNRLFVATASSTWFNSVVLQINATTGASAGPNILPGGDVYGGALQISPDRKTLYYATYGLSPGTLYQIDVSQTNGVIKWQNSQDIGENGEDLVLSNDGSMVAYVCGYGDQGYQIPNFSTANMSLKGLFPTGAYPDSLAYSPDGKLAYTSQWPYPTAIDVWNTTTSSLVGQFGAEGTSSDMAVDSSGRDLFVSYADVPYNSTTNLVVYSVPEPCSAALAASAILATVGFALRRRKRLEKVTRMKNE